MASSHDRHENGEDRQHPVFHEQHEDSASAGPGFWTSVWENNKGALLILIAEAFGSTMDAIARFLQQGEDALPTLQIIVFRMGITSILSLLYMWYIKVPHYPFGAPEVRGWLVLRGMLGFMGMFALYYSVHYLPLAEATVFRLLIPLTTAWACHVLLGQPFARKQLIAGLIAMAGVIIIAHPESIFGKVNDDTIEADAITTFHGRSSSSSSSSSSNDDKGDLDQVTPAQRTLAIGVAMFGIIGATGAYTCIRCIGDRAHALMSVNYFAFIASVGSTIALLAGADGGFVMPHGVREWVLLVTMGLFGFVLQFLLTKGLTLDKSPKATSMLYSQVVFALIFDWLIWNVLPGGWSIVGGLIVIASTLWSALQKNAPAAGAEGKGKGRATASASASDTNKIVPDEETALLGPQIAGVQPARS